MARFTLIILLGLVLLAGCSAPTQGAGQPTQPEVETVAPTESEATGIPPTQTLPEPTPSPLPPTEPPESTTTPTATPTSEPEPTGAWIAYVGDDGNIWLVDPATDDSLQVTQDANPIRAGVEPEGQVVAYCCPEWSSDGTLLAFRRELGEPVDEGYQYQFDLWVYAITSGDTRPVLENQEILGFAWRPGTHLIAYGQPIPFDYFTGQSSQEVQGIWAVDADTGQTRELVPAERGYPIAYPKWTTDGRFLSFEEVLYIEGRGQFAYYDFEEQQYIAWDEVIGGYSWSQDAEHITYDRLAYAPSGTERIWVRDRLDEEERALSPEYEAGYAFNPVFSTTSERLAYFAELSMNENGGIELFVLDFPNGEPLSLGSFEQPQNLGWSPNGEDILLSAGPFEERQVIVVSLNDGSSHTLTEGSQPAWQPSQP